MYPRARGRTSQSRPPGGWAALARFDNRPFDQRTNSYPRTVSAVASAPPGRRSSFYAQKHRQRFRRINCNRIMNGIWGAFRAK